MLNMLRFSTSSPKGLRLSHFIPITYSYSCTMGRRCFLRRKQISTAVRDGSLAFLLDFSVAIGGWNIRLPRLSSFGGYRKQRSRTGRESTRDHLRGVARRGGFSAERRSLLAALGGGGRSPRLPNERDPQLLQGRGANNGCAWTSARGGRPRARRPLDKGRAFGPVPMFLTLHHPSRCRSEAFSAIRLPVNRLLGNPSSDRASVKRVSS